MYFKFNKPTTTARGAQNAQPDSFGYDGLPVTPADATPLPNGLCAGIAVTGAGNVAGTTPSGATFVLTGLPAGAIVNIDATVIAATGTTATGVFALY